MKPTVHILATVRKPALLDAALLVFRTLRTGFPAANVCVWGNGLDGWAAMLLQSAADHAGAKFKNLAPTSHDAWIDSLLEESTEPFWICDTDIVFWQPVEAWFDPSFAKTSALYAGRHEPLFHEEWTDTYHVERLHTCLMWFNPPAVRAAMREFMSRIPAPWGHVADFPFIRQHIVPVRGGKPLFYDTCAGLFHAIGGTPFTPSQDAAFEHLHCATYADALENKAFEALHRRVYQDHKAAAGIKTQQDAYYLSRAVKPGKAKRRNHAL